MQTPSTASYEGGVYTKWTTVTFALRGTGGAVTPTGGRPENITQTGTPSAFTGAASQLRATGAVVAGIAAAFLALS